MYKATNCKALAGPVRVTTDPYAPCWVGVETGLHGGPKSNTREAREQNTGAKRKVGVGFGGAKTKVQHGRPAKKNKTGLPMSERGKKVDEMHEAGRAAKASAKDATKKAAKEAKDPKGAKATQKVSCVLNGW